MVFGPNDLIIKKDSNGKYSAGGFNINSCILQSDESPYVTIQNGGNSSKTMLDGLKNLAVPAGLLYLQQSLSTNYFVSNKDEAVSDSLYNKLFNLASLNEEETIIKEKNNKKKMTRKINKERNTIKKNTRKKNK